MAVLYDQWMNDASTILTVYVGLHVEVVRREGQGAGEYHESEDHQPKHPWA